MNRTRLLAVFAALIALAVSASAQQPSAVYTFVCHGPQDQGICPDGGVPTWIIQGADGSFYGTAGDTKELQGQVGGGLVFSLSPAGQFQVLYKFEPGPEGNYPNGDFPILLVEGPDGRLYGETGVGGANGVGTLFRLNEDGSGFKLIHSFCVGCSDGYDPLGMVAGADGNVYGTTLYGSGTGAECRLACGLIFRIDVAKTTYEPVAPLGFNPSSMVVGPNGTLYGTEDGPAMFNYNETTGEFQLTHLDLDGYAVLPVFGSNGNLYGLYENILKGVGLFEVQPDGTGLQTFPFIANFDIITGEASSLVLGSDSNLWMTRYGGTFGDGEILTFSPTNGSLIQTLAPFSLRAAVGAYPVDLISTTEGALWGLAQGNGVAPPNSYADGVVFSLTLGSQ